MTADLDPMSVRLQALLERIADGYTRGEQARVAARAREEFLEATGRVHEEDVAFDERMALFTEWFLLDRPLTGAGGPTPCEEFAAREGAAADLQTRQDLLALCTSHRTLLQLVSSDEPGARLVDDLLYGMRWEVCAPDGLPGLDVGNLFEARLVGVGGEVHFTGAFCYHPPEVSPRIRRFVERTRERGEAGPAVLERLLSLRLAYDRTAGVGADRIYVLEH